QERQRDGQGPRRRARVGPARAGGCRPESDLDPRYYADSPQRLPAPEAEARVMARYTESACRICRRENLKMYLKGDRCYTDKCAIERRPYPPGQHGQGRAKFSEYGVQLREKQKVKRLYGLLESQFRGYYLRGSAAKGKTGENLLQYLEQRLDNV